MTCGTLFKDNRAVGKLIVEYMGKSLYLRVYRADFVNCNHYSCVVTHIVCEIIVACVEYVASVYFQKTVYIRIKSGYNFLQILDGRAGNTVNDRSVFRAFQHLVQLCEEAVELLVDLTKLLHISYIIGGLGVGFLCFQSVFLKDVTALRIKRKACLYVDKSS